MCVRGRHGNKFQLKYNIELDLINLFCRLVVIYVISFVIRLYLILIISIRTSDVTRTKL
jgi:phage shock protein PspC (stress-responsive transcriptional regulator)